MPVVSDSYQEVEESTPFLLDLELGFEVLGSIASCRDSELEFTLQDIIQRLTDRLGANSVHLSRFIDEDSPTASFELGSAKIVGSLTSEQSAGAAGMDVLIQALRRMVPLQLQDLTSLISGMAADRIVGAWVGSDTEGAAVIFRMPSSCGLIPLMDSAALKPMLSGLLSGLRRRADRNGSLRNFDSRATDAMPSWWAGAIDTIQDGIVLYDAADRILTYNHGYRELFGTIPDPITKRVSAEQFIDVEASEYALPDGRFMTKTQRFLPTGERVEIHKDITRLKVAEQRLRNLIDGARICTWEWNVKTGEHSVNEYWAALLGYTLDELRPVTFDTWRTRVHPDDLAVTEALFDKAISDDKFVYLAEYRLHHKSGRWIWVLDTGRTLHRGADGTPELIAGVQVDISEQKAREAALTSIKAELERSISERERVEQRLVDIASVSDGWLWEMDSDRRYSLILDGKFFDDGGVPKEGLIGRTQEEWLDSHPDMYSGIDWASLLQRLNSNQPFRDFIYRAPQSVDGVTRWRRMTGTPIFDADGTFTGYRGVGSDITELYQAKAKAEEASHTKSMFVANMSHEIRTPLNGVLGMAEVLDNALSDPEHKRMIGTIRRSGESLLNILNDVLDISKIEAGKLELECVPFRVQDLAERVEELHALRAEEKQLELDVLVGAGSDMQFLGDPYRVQQILNNLVSNAIKFTEKGEVEVKIAGRNGSQLFIEVRDTGIGMTPAQLARLHDEFTQADVSVTRRFGGTGLGMAITRTLVERMGGTIDVASELDAGTTIKVWLPLKANSVEIDAPAGNSEMPISLDGLRILAADDNSTNRAVLDAMLSRRGGEVVLVSDGKEAVAAFSAERFDVVLLDIAMPVMDGLSALREIREIERKAGRRPLPIIAITANVMAHQISEYLACGFDLCLAKPLDSTQLAFGIRSLLSDQFRC